MARRPLERRFSWSVSRDRLFRGCPRAYYYHYYGSWGGWERGAAPDVRELYVLKQLETRHQWVGHAVHAVLEQVLRGLRDGRPLSRAEADRQLTGFMRNTFDGSRRGRYWREPKTGGLVEHEYGLPVTGDEWRTLHAEAGRALAGAFDLGLLDRVAAIGPADWLAVEARDAFPLDGVPIWCVPDLAFREGDQVVIVDWKTGPPEPPGAAGGAPFQLACYGLYARARLGARAETLHLGVAYLGLPEYREASIDEAGLAAAEATLRASIAAMQARLVDRAADLARVEDFPRTEDQRRCTRCPFRRPCRGAAWLPPAEPPPLAEAV